MQITDLPQHILERMKFCVRRSTVVLTILFSAIIIGCGPPEENGNASTDYILGPTEVSTCLSEGVDTAAIKVIRQSWRTSLKVLKADSVLKSDGDGHFIWIPSPLRGVMFETLPELAIELAAEYSDTLSKLDHIIFVFKQFKGIDYPEDRVAIIKGKDQYDILKECQTDGSSNDIDNDSLISIIHNFDAKYDLTLVGAGMDWCQFSIGKDPENWDAFAQEVYGVCPDVVEKGTGTVADLGAEMKRTHMLYLWWN